MRFRIEFFCGAIFAQSVLDVSFKMLDLKSRRRMVKTFVSGLQFLASTKRLLVLAGWA